MSCQVLPVEKRLSACLIVFKELASCSKGQKAFEAVLSGIHYNARELDQKDDVDINYNVPSMAEWKNALLYLAVG